MAGRFIVMVTACAFGACAFVSATPQPEPEPEHQPLTTFHSHGTARDGDDLEFSVRMNDFDAPERGKVCGDVNLWSASRDALNDIVRDRSVDCTLNRLCGRPRCGSGTQTQPCQSFQERFRARQPFGVIKQLLEPKEPSSSWDLVRSREAAPLHSGCSRAVS